ncbi:hypothetical protein BJ912DRAFT_1053727 [Pholiota molesta]|nr:hypothetical protein BJ912DRAFT_1053727 [Pholiota molesta]
MSSTSEDQIVLPNPFTPMAFLPPKVAFQITLNNYVAVGITAVLIWDILTHLSEDYRILTRYRIRFPTITYFVARISILLYVITCVVFKTAPTNACVKLGQIMEWCFLVVQSSTSLLFVLRVWAIFRNNYYVCAFFALTWLAVVGATVNVGLSLEVGNIGTTRYCVYTRSPDSILTFVMALVHETLIFFAITWLLVHNMVADRNLSQGVRIVVFGDYLPIFSKALLKDGQLYYLTTLTTNLGAVILYYMPMALGYKILLLLPNLALTNLMACRVYRKTKLGSWDSSMDTTQLRFHMTTRKSEDPVIPLYLGTEPRQFQETESRIQADSSVTDLEDIGSGSVKKTGTGDMVLAADP